MICYPKCNFKCQKIGLKWSNQPSLLEYPGVLLDFWWWEGCQLVARSINSMENFFSRKHTSEEGRCIARVSTTCWIFLAKSALTTNYVSTKSVFLSATFLQIGLSTWIFEINKDFIKCESSGSCSGYQLKNILFKRFFKMNSINFLSGKRHLEYYLQF